jgi:asparagine synthase (glutamine-hydrolysing)
VSRWLAGTFDPRGRLPDARLAAIPAPERSKLVDLKPLRVRHDGAESPVREPWCLLDGWLDNAAELGEMLELEDRPSPERVLAAGWRRWGRELLERLRGDFVVVVWDAARREGLLARDQLGARSLYLHDSSDGLRFAGEVRDLLALLPTRPAPDPASVAHWVSTSEPPGSSTMFEGIRRLGPGTALLLEGDRVREHVYWRPRFSEPVQTEIVGQIRTALEVAVRRRIDVSHPTGVLMSGGLDSASVAALAAEQAPPGQLLAYSGVFPEHPAVDEADLVDQLRDSLRLSGATAQVRPGGLLASAFDSARRWSMPLVGWGDFWVVPLLRVAAEEGVKVVLGGDGGDELFGARSYLLADRVRQGHPLQALKLARELPGAGYGPPRREILAMLVNVAAMGALPYRLHRLMRAPLTGLDAPGWLRPPARRHLRSTRDALAWKRLDGPRWWADIAYGLTRGIEDTGVFAQQRRTAAAAGLDARHPLLDLDLVELGLRQPPLCSYDRYLNRPVLRAATDGLLPDTVRLRPQKVLFDSLLIDCLAGPDAQAVRVLLGPGAELGAYVELDRVATELLDSDRLRRAQPFRWMWQLWRLCTAECWLRLQADLDGTGAVGVPGPSKAQVTLKGATPARKAVSYVFPP